MLDASGKNDSTAEKRMGCAVTPFFMHTHTQTQNVVFQKAKEKHFNLKSVISFYLNHRLKTGIHKENGDQILVALQTKLYN